MKKKTLFALSAVALSGLALVSCGEEKKPVVGEGKAISLIYSGTGSDKDFNMTLLEDFKEARKAMGDTNTYTIEYVEHGPDAVDSEVLDWTAESAPDVYEFASDKITGLYQKGALARLTGDYKKFVTTSNSDLGVDLATFMDNIYAYPYTGDNTYYLQYDKSKLSEEDVKTVEGILTKCQENGWKFGYDLGNAFFGGAALFTYGSDYSIVYDEDGSVNSIEADFDQANGIKAAKAVQSILTHSAWQNATEAPSESNGLAACIAGTWDISKYKEALGEDYGCAVMPTVTVEGDTKHLTAFLGGKLLGVNPNRAAGDASRIKAAHELAKFLSDKECQLKRFETNSIAPCNKEAAANEKVLANENIKVLLAHAEYSHAQTAVPSKFWSAPQTFIEGLKTGVVTDLAAGLKTMNDTIKEVTA